MTLLQDPQVQFKQSFDIAQAPSEIDRRFRIIGREPNQEFHPIIRGSSALRVPKIFEQYENHIFTFTTRDYTAVGERGVKKGRIICNDLTLRSVIRFCRNEDGSLGQSIDNPIGFELDQPLVVRSLSNDYNNHDVLTFSIVPIIRNQVRTNCEPFWYLRRVLHLDVNSYTNLRLAKCIALLKSQTCNSIDASAILQTNISQVKNALTKRLLEYESSLTHRQFQRLGDEMIEYTLLQHFPSKRRRVNKILKRYSMALEGVTDINKMIDITLDTSDAIRKRCGYIRRALIEPERFLISYQK